MVEKIEGAIKKIQYRDTNNTEAQDTETQKTLGTRHRDTNNTGHKTQNEHKQN
jgi:hypothetical protein